VGTMGGGKVGVWGVFLFIQMGEVVGSVYQIEFIT